MPVNVTEYAIRARRGLRRRGGVHEEENNNVASDIPR